jgi:lysophospholipase L1-like esterase
MARWALFAIPFSLAVMFASGYEVSSWRHRQADVTLRVAQERRVGVILSHASQENNFDFLILGDGITESSFLPSLCGKKILNAGVGAYTVPQGAPLLGQILPLTKVRNIVIALGLNDAKKTLPRRIENFATEYDALTAMAASKSSRVWVATVGPITTSMPLPESSYDSDYIDGINRQIQRIAQKRAIDLIDLNQALSDANNRLAQAYTVDGVHLTAQGYLTWHHIIESQVCK